MVKILDKVAFNYLNRSKSFASDVLTGRVFGFDFQGFSNTLSGVNINKQNAEKINAFYTCLRIKAETTATLKTTLQLIQGDAQYRATDHPVDRLLSYRPNPRMNAFNFWYIIQMNEDIHGNAYAWIERDSAAIPKALHPWMAGEVSVREDLSDGSIWYIYKGKAYPARDVLHFKQNSLDGIVGRSIIDINRETLGLAKKQETYAARVYGEKPPAVFEDGAGLKRDQAIDIANGFKEHVKKGLTPMVWGGLKYKSIMMPPGDAQFIESKQFTKGDIYGMFRIPPYKLQSYSRETGATYKNVEQQNISFVNDVVIPSTESKQIECETKLLAGDSYGKYEVQFDFSLLLKADVKTEQEYIESMLTRGVINRNQARKRMGMNPIDPKVDEHGDRYFIQAGFVPTDRIDDFIDGKSNGEIKQAS